MSAVRVAREPRTAVLIPCYNEEATIATVVRKFHAEVPSAAIYVFDNNSSDRTAEEAARAGAVVVREPRRGKGYVVQAMFRRVDADVYVLVDGDDTYPAHAVAALTAPVLRGEADMVIGSRLHRDASSQFRLVNRLGNTLYVWLIRLAFGVRITDLLSGYRAFSRRFVRSVPLVGGGFETEAEMTIKALHRGLTIVDVPVDLVPRPPGSSSKIRLVHDGFVILATILSLLRDYKPLTFFGTVGLGVMLLGVAVGALALSDCAIVGVLGRAGTVGVALALLLAGLTIAIGGLVVHTIAHRFQELDLQLRSLADDQGRPRDRDPSAP